MTVTAGVVALNIIMTAFLDGLLDNVEKVAFSKNTLYSRSEWKKFDILFKTKTVEKPYAL